MVKETREARNHFSILKMRAFKIDSKRMTREIDASFIALRDLTWIQISDL